MTGFFWAFFALLQIFASHQFDRKLDNFVFGSCNKHQRDTNTWESILNTNSDLVLILGDLMYSNTYDANEYQQHLNLLYQQRGFSDLLRNVDMITIWDDHEYGKDNDGIENPFKYQAQQLYLDFFQIPDHSPRRYRQGIYDSYTYGSGEQMVKILLLDTRFNKEVNSSDGDILGEEQWLWLENELAQSEAKIHFITSTISVLTKAAPGIESWYDLPKAKRRLFALLDKYDVPGVIFLSGDLHIGAILSDRIQDKQYFELMSSGLNNQVPKNLRFPLRLLLPDVYMQFEKNFGQVRIHWEKSPLELSYLINKDTGKRIHRQDFVLLNKTWQMKH
tara:strand:- start:22123 stop:23121 length:999 start_codon:yes stop_codon:yes gene_type:complete